VTQAFIGELANVAETTGCPHLSALIARLRRPVRVAVTGRAGVGVRCVAAALRRRDVVVVPAGGPFDVLVLAAAETVKDEDAAAVRAAAVPTVIALTKADLAGAGPGGPIAVARARATAIGRRTGVPVVPMVGLLAALGDLDADLVAALRTFVTEPPDLSAVDAFVEHPHPVDPGLRARLLARLDRFGIAHAVLALADGCDPAGLADRLAGLGNADEVVDALERAAAPVRYRRMRAAMAELRCLAVQSGDDRLQVALASDAIAMAVMTVAVEVVEAAGVSVDRGDTAAAHLARAVRWRRYGRGPVTALHRQCSADIVRGSLRLWDGAAG
jgi:hypothetical protein